MSAHVCLGTWLAALVTGECDPLRSAVLGKLLAVLLLLWVLLQIWLFLLQPLQLLLLLLLLVLLLLLPLPPKFASACRGRRNPSSISAGRTTMERP